MNVKSFVVVALLIWFNVAGASNLTPYAPNTDLKREFAAAQAEARSAGKKVLIIFGSGWCPDCREFDQQLAKEPLRSLIEKKFIVVKADIGNWDRNMDFANRFGNPVKQGIPSIAIVDAEREAYFATRGGELAQARSLSINKLVSWLTVLADGAALKTALRSNF